MRYNEQGKVLASWYQGESLDEYLNALFGYYEAENKASVSPVDNDAIYEEVDKTVSVPAPTVQYRSTFETILAKFGLDLGDATFDEIIKGDYYSVLKRHGLVDHHASNNVSYQGLGSIGS